MKPPTFSFADHKRWNNLLLFSSLFKAKVPWERDERRKQRSLEMGTCSLKRRKRQLSNAGGCRGEQDVAINRWRTEKWPGRADVGRELPRGLWRGSARLMNEAAGRLQTSWSRHMGKKKKWLQMDPQRYFPLQQVEQVQRPLVKSEVLLMQRLASERGSKRWRGMTSGLKKITAQLKWRVC